MKQYQQYKAISSNHTDDYNLTTQNWNIAKWLEVRGIDIDTLEGFDNIDDVVTLLNLRDELWHRMNPNEQGVWSAYWGLVYKKKRTLTQKFWRKFEKIVTAIDQRDQAKAQLIQRIKALRQNPIKQGS